MNQGDLHARDQQHFLYKQVLQPSGVSHCCQAHFTQPASRGAHDLPNVILIRYNLLQVYQARRSARDEEACWLELLAEHYLQGTVESLGVLPCRAPGIQRESILLTFRDAKLVVLSWDELLGNVHTSSLHFWEDDPSVVRNRPLAPPLGPQVSTDPQGRCAAVLLFSNQLALLPSTRADLLDADADSSGLTQAARLESSYTLPLSKLGVKEARDVCLLHRYNEPVLLVLHEGSPSWAGALVNKKDTMCLTAYSLNLAQQKHLRLWHVEDLPTDAHKLIPVPLGGALVICQSLILYQSQGVSCGLAVSSKAYAGVVPPFMDINPMREAPSVTAARHAAKFCTNIEPDAAASASKGAPRAEGFELDLQGSVGVWLTPTTLMLALESERIVLVILEVSGGSVRKIKLEKSSDSPRLSCICRVGASWVFLGSWLGDSLLIHTRSKNRAKKPLQLQQPKKEILAIEGPKSEPVETEAEKATQLASGKAVDATEGQPQSADEADKPTVENGSAPQAVNGEPKQKTDPLVLANGKSKEAPSGEADVEDTEGDSGNGVAKKEPVDTSPSGPTDEQPAKRQKLQSPPPQFDQVDDEFESIFQSIETARISTLKLSPTSFSFKKVGAFVGLGPIRSMVHVEQKRQDGTTKNEGHQYVACTGHGKAGSIVTLTQHIQPEIFASVSLQGIRGMWTVRFRPEGLPWEPDFAYHAFLVLSLARTTKVLEGGAELLEMKAEQVGFALDQPTLLAANLLSLSRTVQVCPGKVVFLAGSSKQSESSVQQLLEPQVSPTGVQGEKAAQAAQPENLANVEIVAASAADPYVLLHLSNGSAALLKSSLDSGKLEVVQAAREMLHEVPAAEMSSHITSCTLYQDHTGWLASATDTKSSANDTETSVFCVVCNAKGLLQMFALPEMSLVFDHSPVTEGSSVLSGDPFVEASIAKDPTEEDGQGDGDADMFSTRPIVIEVKMESFAGNEDVLDPDASLDDAKERMPCERPVLLMLLSNGGLLCYQAFLSPLGVRFTRLKIDWLSHADGRGPRGASRRVTRFDGLGEAQKYSGMFVCGDRPLWLIASRGGLLTHSMETSGAVVAMTPFNNQNCPQGFITMQEKESEVSQASLQIATFPPGVDLEFPWPFKKVGQGNTVSNLSHLPDYNLFCCSITREVAHQKWLSEEEGGDLQATYAYTAAMTEAKEKPKEEITEVRLMSPLRWSTVWHYELMPAETATCIRCLPLFNSMTNAQENLLIIGTAFNFGEDYPCYGRILVLRLEHQQQELEEQSSGAWGGTLLYQREVQGPVMALAAVDGILVVGWGPRLDAFAWNGQRLQTTCFHEGSILITSICNIKRFVVVGDIHKSITFLQLSPDNHSFQNLSKDFDNCDVLATEFLIHKSKLFVLVGDAAKNLRMLAYQIDNPQSWQGKCMIPVGSIHAGSETGSMLSRRVSVENLQGGPSRGALCCGMDGSIATLVPLWEEDLAPPLRALKRLLELKAPQACGLNPRAYRERYKSIPAALSGGECWGKGAPSSTVLDGDLLWQFQYLTHRQQTQISTKLGVDKDQVLALLDSIASALS